MSSPDRIDSYWASFFGLSREDYAREALQIVPHCKLKGYRGVWMLRRGSATILSAPPELVPLSESALSSRITVTDDDLIALFAESGERIVGPAYQGYLVESRSRPEAAGARMLSSEDNTALLHLQQACGPEEWDHSDIHVGQAVAFGSFVGSQLVAACNYRMEADDVCAPGVITHPGYRGRGYGRSVLAAATEHAVSHSYLVLYQTLLANRPAIAIAEQLGYREYATSLAIRLRA